MTITYYQNHAHDLELCDWHTCICGRTFKTTRALHGHVTRANRADREASK